MLILTRKPQEKIVIGENIVITFLGFKGFQLRIGIEAPKEISIRREEVPPLKQIHPNKSWRYPSAY